ncbi:MAG: hypothetical protein WDM81_04020 [Rhizomicrobium sp.]
MPPEELARIGVLVAVEADQVDRCQRAGADLARRQAQGFEAELHVLQHGQPGEQREALEHHGDAVRRPVDRMAEIGQRAALRLGEARDEPQEGRFSRAGAAEQPHDLALLERQLDAVEHQQFAAARLGEGAAHGVHVEEKFVGHGIHPCARSFKLSNVMPAQAGIHFASDPGCPPARA